MKNFDMILIYGPSGIGKSTAIRVLSKEISQAFFASLDDEAAELGRRIGLISHEQGAGELQQKLRADGFLELGIKAAEELAGRNRETLVVLDVGAGFLESNLVEGWLLSQESIVLSASAKVVYERLLRRNPGEPRSLESYSRQEFSRRRIALYALAKHRVDAEGSEPDVISSLRRILRQLHRSGSSTAID